MEDSFSVGDGIVLGGGGGVGGGYLSGKDGRGGGYLSGEDGRGGRGGAEAAADRDGGGVLNGGAVNDGVHGGPSGNEKMLLVYKEK